jgi:transcriptional regulator with XRE-family HTH domain
MAPAPISRVRRTGRSRSGRRAREIRRSIGADIRQLRLDAGISQRRLADAAGINQGFLSQVEAARTEPSISFLAAIGDVLNADLSVRFYPSGGPALRDRHPARLVESLVEAPRIRRGEPFSRLLSFVQHAAGSTPSSCARNRSSSWKCEAESTLHRLEQQVRRHAAKAESLPSAELWRGTTSAGTAGPEASRLLLLRSTRANREIAADFRSTLATAYPARSADVYAALTGAGPWPGSGILWATVTPQGARLLEDPPRGVELGR